MSKSKPKPSYSNNGSSSSVTGRLCYDTIKLTGRSLICVSDNTKSTSTHGGNCGHLRRALRLGLGGVGSRRFLACRHGTTTPLAAPRTTVYLADLSLGCPSGLQTHAGEAAAAAAAATETRKPSRMAPIGMPSSGRGHLKRNGRR